jgi:hypothetical protein
MTRDAPGWRQAVQWALIQLAVAGSPRCRQWHSDRVTIVVHLDPEGRVNSYNAFPMRRAEESPLEMLRHWLGR